MQSVRLFESIRLSFVLASLKHLLNTVQNVSFETV